MAKRGHGEGSIYKDEGRDCWYASVRREGKRKKVACKTRREAAEALKKLLREADEQGLVAAGPRTVEDYLRWWLDTKRPGLKPSTIRHYDLCIRRMLPFIGSVKLSQLSAAHVERMYAAFRSPAYRDVEGGTGSLNEQTIFHHHSLLRNALRKAVRLEYLRRSPLDNVEPPRVRDKREMKTLSAEQLRHLFAVTAQTRFHALWVVLGTTGMRVGEALGLKWSDYDERGQFVVIQRAVQRVGGQGIIFMSPKTAKSRRVVPLPVWVGEVLVAQRLAIDDMRAQAQELWEEHDLLFPSEVGTPLDPSNINKQFHKALRSAGLPSLRLHDLRHTFATLAFSQRISAREVQEILGHSTVTTTLATYTHVVPGVIRHAADQMGDLLMPDQGKKGSS